MFWLWVRWHAVCLGHSLKRLSPNDREILFILGDTRNDENVPRYQFLILNFFAEAGYNIYVYQGLDFGFFKRLGDWGQHLYAVKNLRFITDIPRRTEGMVFAFDHEEPDESLLKLRWKKLLYVNSQKPPSWKVGDEIVRIPYVMFPGVYRSGRHRDLETFRNQQRKIRAFFAGNMNKIYYDNPDLENNYGQMTRHAGVEALLNSGRKIIHQPEKKEFDRLIRGDRYSRECVIFDFFKFKIKAARWLNVLSTSDFFICFSGTDYPFSHNSVESLAVGTIPILSYADWFDPPLEHKKNAIVYAGKEDLIQKIEEVMTMGADEIGAMKKNAARYYDEHLSPASFARRFETCGEVSTLMMFPRLVVSDPGGKGQRQIEALNAQIGRVGVST